MLEGLGRGIASIANYPVSLVQEIIRIFPDGLIMGLALFSVITLSFPYGIFFMSMLESLLGFHGLRSLNNYLNLSTGLPTKSGLTSKCMSGFVSKNFESLSLFGVASMSAFPSAPIFILSTASAYVLASLFRFRKELEVLGPQFSQKFYIAGIALPLLIVTFSLFRIYFNCDEFTVILMSILAGLLLGLLLVEQNYRLFGLQSVNLVGVPILRERTAAGKKLYICSDTPETLGA
jgi:hypothetical protein